MTAFMAERCRRSPLLAAITYASRFVALGLLSSSLGAQSQSPPPSALINQRLGDTLERARALSPRTNEESLAYFREDVDAALARALERVWDPTQPRERSPRTTWGDPDLQGYWLNLGYTPLERPDELAGKPLYTAEEAIEAFQIAVAEDAVVDPATVHYDWKEFGMDNWQSPVRPNRRTSLIVDPPDGRLPPLTPEGQERFAAQARRHTIESRNLYERCVTGNQGPPRLPLNHDSESQIVQTPDYVLIMTQANSDVRVISVDERPHAPGNLREWLGDPRGHWEGDTLVVESTNFHEDRKWRGAGGGMHLIERFTRTDEDTLLYEATVNDPMTWETPWTVEVPWPRIEPPLFEFACHEQNYGIINVLNGARIRAQEFQAQQTR